MGSMDFMEKLLDGIAVEWRPLGEVILPTSNIKWRDTDRAYLADQSRLRRCEEACQEEAGLLLRIGKGAGTIYQRTNRT